MKVSSNLKAGAFNFGFVINAPGSINESQIVQQENIATNYSVSAANIAVQVQGNNVVL
jgi:hypothetical protein